jgi:phosphatidylglycerophosphate synthase
MQPKPNAVRVHQSFLAAPERELLIWLADHTPAWILPDHLTLLGCAGALLSGLAFWASAVSPHFLWLAGAGIAINWFGDSLDGSLARRRKIEKPAYGFFIDHATDVASQAFVILGFGLSHYLRFEMACLLLLSFWMISLYTYIRAVAIGVFQISFWGIGPTELRVGLLCCVGGMMAVGPVSVTTPIGDLSPLDTMCALIFTVAFVWYLWMIRSEGRRLAILNPPSDQPVTSG